jgi:tetratricopeptide (TPR) repeat protein
MKGMSFSRIKLVGIGLLAFLIGFLLFRGLRPDPRGDVLATYYTAFPVPTTAMPEDGALHWIHGTLAYQKKDYSTARDAWQKSLALGEQQPFLLHFYIGQCDMALAQYASARDAFAQVLDTRNDIHPLARWYLALAHIAEDDPAAARPHLQILVEEGGYRARDAADLLAGM